MKTKWNLSATGWCYYPASTQPPKDIPLWSYFGRVVSDHMRTKIGRIKFLIYFGSVIAGMHLASENIENFPWKAILLKMFKLTYWGRPKNVTLQMSLWDVFRTFIVLILHITLLSNFLLVNLSIQYMLYLVYEIGNATN